MRHGVWAWVCSVIPSAQTGAGAALLRDCPPPAAPPLRRYAKQPPPRFVRLRSGLVAQFALSMLENASAWSCEHIRLSKWGRIKIQENVASGATLNTNEILLRPHLRLTEERAVQSTLIATTPHPAYGLSQTKQRTM